MSKAKLFIQTAPKPVPMKMLKETLEKRSKKVWDFLEKHPAITINRMTTAVSYDPGNFRRLMYDKKKIPQALLLRVEKYLSDYGFN